MGNPQKIKFFSVDDLLDHLPQQERAIVENLRELVLDALPCCTEKLSYNVPFYAKRKNICFIWPASVPWGNLQEGVALGFMRGDLLDPEGDMLERNGRKSVGRLIITAPHMMDQLLISSFLLEADLLDKR